MDERCRCPACRKAHADAERSRTRTNAQTRLPAKVRQQLLNDIYAGRQFKTIVRDLGLTSQQGWGITKTDRVGFERGDEISQGRAVDQNRPDAYLVQGSQRTVMVRVSWPCSVVPHVGSAQVNTNADAKASPA